MAKEYSNTGTLNATPNSCVTCAVSITRRVRYVFKTGLWPESKKSEKKLTIPVVAALGGRIKTEYARKTDTAISNVPFDVWAEPGQKVSLFLNSDAAFGRRHNAVFEVTPTRRNIVVMILEKRGKLGEQDTPKWLATKTDERGTEYDQYEAILSGDTWKKVSHKFDAQEAEALIPKTSPASVRAAVLSLYDGNDNARDNVTQFDVHTDGLTRVHPLAWMAVIEAAQQAGVSQIKTTSAWRPMLGSIVHRSGLGLDVGYLDGAHLRRKGLLAKDKVRSSTVTAKERELFAAKEAAEKEAAVAEANLKTLEKQLSVARGKDPVLAAKLVRDAKDADIVNRAAAFKAREAAKAWNDERDANEPAAVKSFRGYLLRCECVTQVFDPWFMDANTKDDVAPQPNQQKSGNDQLHATHLHVTVSRTGK
jgi:hypothetical protein